LHIIFSSSRQHLHLLNAKVKISKAQFTVTGGSSRADEVSPGNAKVKLSRALFTSPPRLALTTSTQ
jgi:hypothetical protein